jgi:hypothetical protein
MAALSFFCGETDCTALNRYGTSRTNKSGRQRHSDINGQSDVRSRLGICPKRSGDRGSALRREGGLRLAREDLRQPARNGIRLMDRENSSSDLGERGGLRGQEKRRRSDQFDGTAKNARGAPESIAKAATAIDRFALKYRCKLQRREHDFQPLGPQSASKLS